MYNEVQGKGKAKAQGKANPQAPHHNVYMVYT